MLGASCWDGPDMAVRMQMSVAKDNQKQIVRRVEDVPSIATSAGGGSQILIKF